MPCSGCGSSEDPRERLKAELDQVTQHLCEVMQGLEDGRITSLMYVRDKATTWWNIHKENDRVRRLNEENTRKAMERAQKEVIRLSEIREKALQKLTREEIKALNLK